MTIKRQIVIGSYRIKLLDNWTVTVDNEKTGYNSTTKCNSPDMANSEYQAACALARQCPGD